MSFKREGDDAGQLGVLQKRRVADLLANYIPEEEALLLRSGRYACTVCAHRPVFDTLDVLAVHRAGKKHTGNLQRFYSRKHPRDAALKPQQEEEEEEADAQGSPAPLLARTRSIARSALLRAAPYSSCCRRNGAGGTRTGTSTTPTPSQKDGGAVEAVSATPTALLPGHRGGAAEAPRAAPARTPRSRDGKSPVAGAVSPERRRALERYLQLRSSGWIQDPSGKWVKDENVEFDSDEEEPPALLPA
ncbi:sodium channel modifier 1-like [Aegotheles albertisi]